MINDQRSIDPGVQRPLPPAGRVYVQQDANFNATAITDQSGTVLERYVYDPYGRSDVLTASWTFKTGPAAFQGNYAFTQRFQGLRLDLITTNHNARNRDLNSRLSVWNSQDPIGYPDGGNRYQFERNNPVKAVDPFGLRSIVTKPRGRITNLTGGTLPIWNSDVGFGTLGPGQATPIFEDWDFVQVPGGTWVKVRGGCSAMVLPNGSVVSADATLGLGGWALSNWCLIDRNPTRHPGNNFGR